jgi:hypothetical protein
MSHSFAHPCRRQFDRLAYPQVRHAATKASGHDGVSVLVGGIGVTHGPRESTFLSATVGMASTREALFCVSMETNEQRLTGKFCYR